MTSEQDIWDIIVIVIVFDSLHKDFDITTANLLEVGDKTIDRIQSIFQLKKTNNFSKWASKDIRNLAMIFRNKSSKKKVNSNDKCYNCYKFDYFGQNCFLSNRKLNKNT